MYKTEFDTHLVKRLKKHSKSFFNLVRSRKPERHFLERIGYCDIKGICRKDNIGAENPNEFFASVFIVEEAGEVPRQELTSSPEDLSRAAASVRVRINRQSE